MAGFSEGEPRYDVLEEREIDYYLGADAHPTRHKLDLYLPRGKTDFSVVLFVHGGGWMFGEKSMFGINSALARMLAAHGVGCALCNYRLSPGVRHPEHIKDVARAFAWVHRHIGEYGGRADRVFVSGHSAGAHLAALLGADERYLQAERLPLAALRGVIAISGVYTIPRFLFRSVFGGDSAQRGDASPIAHAHAGCPPFLLIYASSDFPFASRMSKELCAALQRAKVPAETLRIARRNHVTIITRAWRPNDPCGRAMLDFVRANEAG